VPIEARLGRYRPDPQPPARTATARAASSNRSIGASASATSSDPVQANDFGPRCATRGCFSPRWPDALLYAGRPLGAVIVDATVVARPLRARISQGLTAFGIRAGLSVLLGLRFGGLGAVPGGRFPHLAAECVIDAAFSTECGAVVDGHDDDFAGPPERPNERR
jgi:hypothetical protein